MTLFLEAKGLVKSYSSHLALDGFDIEIPQHSVFGLLGPNGAGKTTFIRIVNQMIACDRGELKILNKPLHPSHIPMIGYLPEERGLYPKMKVGEQLMYLAQLKGLRKKDARQKLRAWFTRFDLAEWADKTVQDLSKGMAQKVQFISTVIHEPKLLILDEPFSGFDPINAALIRDEILRIKEELGTTIIFSTHRMESVEELCDQIALMHQSKNVLSGGKDAIKNQFRDNTFYFTYSGKFHNDMLQFVDFVENNETEESTSNANLTTTSLIRIKESYDPNTFLSESLKHVQITGFQEKIPSINDIFIKTVQKS